MLNRRLLLSLFLLPLTACGGAGGPSAPAHAPEPTPVASWSVTAPADSIARWAVQSCRGLLGLDRKCVERGLYRVVEAGDVARAIHALDRAVVIAPALLADAHGIAHGLGIAAYRSPETLAATFSSCPTTQISGCHHGVMQGYFLALKRQGTPVDSAILNRVCEPHREPTTAYFQCGHGIGHGLMAVVSGHLPQALEKCDRITSAFIRESCYGGAFMENIVSATHPHHTGEAHAAVSGDDHPAGNEHGDHGDHGAAAPAETGHAGGHGEHAQHDSTAAAPSEHAGHAAPSEHAEHGAGETVAAPWEPLRRSDLLYPCTVVAAHYQAACYDMQSSAAMALTLGNVGAVARACASAPAAHVNRCYGSLGRDVSALAELKHDRAVALCRRAGEEAAPICLAGVASAMHNLANDPADAIAFCRNVPGGPGKEACYRVVNSVVNHAPRERRATLCAAADPEFAAACRTAAGLGATSDD